MIPKAFLDAAFWVTLTFATVTIWLVLQGYWTRWAHRRVDKIEGRLAELEKGNAALNKHLKDLEERNPFAFMRRAN